MPTLEEVLDEGDSTSGHNIVISTGDYLGLRENATEPGGAVGLNRAKLWLQAGSPNTLRFTDESGTVAQPGLYSAMVLNVRDFGAVGDGLTDDSGAIQDALDAARDGSIKTVILPPGIYRVSTTIDHWNNVAVHGAGPAATVIQQHNDITTVWRFEASSNLRAELADLRINGQPSTIPPVDEEDLDYEDYLHDLVSGRVGTGVSLLEATYVELRNVLIWDFVIGIDLADGTVADPQPFSAYNVIGPKVEVARCTTGIRAYFGCNNTTVIGSRVFWCFDDEDTGVGIDVDSAEGLALIGNAIESADTCLRIRDSREGPLRVEVASNYLEPGTNPLTTPPYGGLAYDVVEPNLPDINGNNDPRVVRGLANVVSASRASADLRPSSIHGWDSPSAQFFGARFDGAAQTKRNLIRNGGFGYYGVSSIPEWTSHDLTLAEETDPGEFVTGSRSLRATSGMVYGELTNSFVISDPTVEWITVGVRYRVESGAGFRVTAAAGTSYAQRHDTAESDDVWKEMHVTVRRDVGETQGRVIITPNYDPVSILQPCECLIDEVWAVPGRYAVDSTQYAERIELLDVPLVIAADQNVSAGTSWTPVDISTLASAPLGVCGGLFRLRLTVHDGAGSGLLSDHNWLSIHDGSSDHNRVTAIYGNQPVELHVPLRATNVSGELNRGAATLDCDYEVALVGWILR